MTVETLVKSDMGYNRKKKKHFQSIIYFYIETKQNGKKNVTMKIKNENRLDFNNQWNYSDFRLPDLNTEPNPTHSCYSVNDDCMFEVCTINEESVKFHQKILLCHVLMCNHVKMVDLWMEFGPHYCSCVFSFCTLWKLAFWSQNAVCRESF